MFLCKCFKVLSQILAFLVVGNLFQNYILHKTLPCFFLFFSNGVIRSIFGNIIFSASISTISYFKKSKRGEFYFKPICNNHISLWCKKRSFFVALKKSLKLPCAHYKISSMYLINFWDILNLYLFLLHAIPQSPPANCKKITAKDK